MLKKVLREVVADNISKVDEKEFDRFFSTPKPIMRSGRFLLR